MIAWLEGVLREKEPTRIVLDVQGVGYELMISLSTFALLPDVGKTISVLPDINPLNILPLFLQQTDELLFGLYTDWTSGVEISNG